jgi:hypothetical protein
MPRQKSSKKSSVTVYETPHSAKQCVQEEIGQYLPFHNGDTLVALGPPKSKHPRITMFNDIDLNQWKDYGNIMTDSLWLLGARDKSGVHTGELHGNFIPQLPHQAMLRHIILCQIMN